jgi:hypothetical protein
MAQKSQAEPGVCCAAGGEVAALFAHHRRQTPMTQGGAVMRFLVGFLLGVLIGASVALALAPQPGRETRSVVIERVRQRTRRDGEAAPGTEEP